MTKKEFNEVCTTLREVGKFELTKFIIKATRLSIKQAHSFVESTLDIKPGSRTTRKDYYRRLDKQSKDYLRKYKHKIEVNNEVNKA